MAKDHNQILNELQVLCEKNKHVLNVDNPQDYANFLTLLRGDLIEKYKDFKFNQYGKCNHIWIVVDEDYDADEEKSTRYCGCVKCGLKQNPYYGYVNELDRNIMCSYISRAISPFARGTYYDVVCDLELAMKIWNRIKNTPGCSRISDEKAMDRLRVSLYSIRVKQIDSHKDWVKRNEGRATRLKMRENFNRWSDWDIITHRELD